MICVMMCVAEGWFVIILRAIGTLGLTLSVLATVIVPMPQLPALPPGGFKVGTITDCWMYGSCFWTNI